MKKLLRITSLLLLGMLLAGGRMSFPKKSPMPKAVFAHSIQAQADAASHVTRFLVMGVDRAAKLTDTIFVLSVNEDEKKATVLQIPRDTYANYTDRDYKKLNGALSALGEKGAKELLSRALGVDIHYFIILDLACFSALVDAVGGVDVEIPKDMVYSDPSQGLEINLPAGPRHLSGAEAEKFVRFRSGYVNADLGRLDAQKLFLKAFAKKCASMSGGQMTAMTCTSLTRLQTDIGLPAAIRIMSLLRLCDTEDIPMATLGGQAVQGQSGAWYYVVNRAAGCRMANQYLFPSVPLEETEFDPDGLFDREETQDFHKIYTASEGALPWG